MTQLNTIKRLTTGLFLAITFGVIPSICLGADFKLPDSAELQELSPQATTFYNNGIAALNKVDYINAYNNLSKVAVLRPEAIRINHITAGLSIFRGRQSDSAFARDYYETAINCYNNILQNPVVEPEFRRQVTNELKLAITEKENLAQRDVIREAAGTSFYIDLRREYGFKPKTDGPSKSTTLATPSASPTSKTHNAFPYPGAYFAPKATPIQPNQGQLNPDGMPIDPAAGALPI